MKQILIIWFLFIFFCADSFAVFPVWAENRESREIDALINDEKIELQVLKKKIALQEKTISIEGAKESTVLKHLQKIGTQLKLKERELAIYQLNYKVNQKNIRDYYNKYYRPNTSFEAESIFLYIMKDDSIAFRDSISKYIKSEKTFYKVAEKLEYLGNKKTGRFKNQSVFLTLFYHSIV